MGSESVKSSKYAFEDVFESKSDRTDAFWSDFIAVDDNAVSDSTLIGSDSFFFSDFDFLEVGFEAETAEATLFEADFDSAAVEEANLAARPLSTVYIY